MGAFGPLALIAVSLRLYTRIRFAKVGADDIAIVIGFVRAPEFRGYDETYIPLRFCLPDLSLQLSMVRQLALF